MNEEFEKLTDDERKQFDSLSRQKQIPQGLEDTVVGALKKANLVHSPKPKSSWLFSGLNPVFASLLGVALVGMASWGIWYFVFSSTVNRNPQFILFLRESPEAAKQQLSEREFERLSDAYSEWTDLNRQRGILKEGDNLEDPLKILDRVDGRVVVSDEKPDPKEDLIVGWFIIRAGSFEEAVGIAKTCPFFRYGRIEIRQIEDPKLN